MKSNQGNQGNQGNNTADKGDKQQSESMSRGGTVEKDNMNPAGIGSEQSGTPAGSRQGQPGQRQSNDLAGGYPRSPGAGGKLAADEDMDDDTGLSNRANRQSAEIDQGSRQSQQSNVGRRDDGTPD